MQTDNHINEFKKPLEVLGGYSLDRFRVFNPQTLFELSPKEKYELLKDKRCIVCRNKLRLDIKGNGRCVSKKTKCKFFIRKEVLNKYL